MKAMPEDNSLHLASAVLVHRAALLLKDHGAEGLQEKERKEKKRQSISIILSITFFAGFWGEFFYFVSFCKCMFFFVFFCFLFNGKHSWDGWRIIFLEIFNDTSK